MPRTAGTQVAGAGLALASWGYSSASWSGGVVCRELVRSVREGKGCLPASVCPFDPFILKEAGVKVHGGEGKGRMVLLLKKGDPKSYVCSLVKSVT